MHYICLVGETSEAFIPSVVGMRLHADAIYSDISSIRGCVNRFIGPFPGQFSLALLSYLVNYFNFQTCYFGKESSENKLLRCFDYIILYRKKEVLLHIQYIN